MSLVLVESWHKTSQSSPAQYITIYCYIYARADCTVEQLGILAQRLLHYQAE